MRRTGTTAVIALGRCDNGDDAAPLLVPDILRRRHEDVTIVAADAVDELRDDLQRHETVFIVEALGAAGRPGAVRAIEPDGELSERRGGRSHDPRLGAIIATARPRKGAGPAVVVLGIEGRWFTSRAGMSPEAAAAAHAVADHIVDSLARHAAA